MKNICFENHETLIRIGSIAIRFKIPRTCIPVAQRLGAKTKPTGKDKALFAQDLPLARKKF